MTFTPDYTVLIAGDVFGFLEDDQDTYLWCAAERVPGCGGCGEPLLNHSARHPLRLATERDPWALRVACEGCGWTSEPAEVA